MERMEWHGMLAKQVLSLMHSAKNVPSTIEWSA